MKKSSDLFSSVELAAGEYSGDDAVAGWRKITSDNKLWFLERNVFSSFPENGLEAIQIKNEITAKICNDVF